MCFFFHRVRKLQKYYQVSFDIWKIRELENPSIKFDRWRFYFVIKREKQMSLMINAITHFFMYRAFFLVLIFITLGLSPFLYELLNKCLSIMFPNREIEHFTFVQLGFFKKVRKFAISVAHFRFSHNIWLGNSVPHSINSSSRNSPFSRFTIRLTWFPVHVFSTCRVSVFFFLVFDFLIFFVN